MITFSTPPTEANQLSGIVNVLNILPDNTAKQISPKDVRDAVYTVWENTILKPTSASGSSKYIGIDQYQLKDNSDAATYPKMYFGKKQVGGQFIINDSLLNDLADVDFFFYNMKDNTTVGDYDTTIAILAGTGSFYDTSGEVAAPTIKSTVVSDVLGNYINLNITNNSFVVNGNTTSGGDINIKSNAGYVSINDFIFPKASDITQANDDYVLKYRWVNGIGAYGVWESAFSQSITGINYPQGQVTITGNPIVLNGYNFTDDSIVATAIGGILAGETFSNVDVLDMLRRIIYTYVPPRITTRIIRTSDANTPLNLIEVSEPMTVTSNIRLYYSLTINSTYSVTTNVSISSFDGGITPDSPLPATPIVSGTYDGTVKLSANTGNLLINTAYKIISYTFSVTDSYPTTKTSNSKLTVVLPYFYGTSGTFSVDPEYMGSFILGTNSSAPLGKLNLKLVEPIIGSPTLSSNQSVFITTEGLPSNQGYIYFGYPAQFPLLKEIIDQNGFTVSSTFTTYSVSLNSANGRWAGRPYIFYIKPEITTVPIGSKYQFIFTS